jgi:transcriptional regulator with XRE-family HTH domain
MTPSEIKERRKLLNLTQADVAKRIGITLRHYHRIESGTSPLTTVMKKVVKMELET